MDPQSRFKHTNDDGNEDKPNRQEPRQSQGRGPDYVGIHENSTNMNFNTYINRSNYYRPTFHQYGQASQSYHSEQHNDLPSYGNDRGYARSNEYYHHPNDSRRKEAERGYSPSNCKRGDCNRSSRNETSSRHPRGRDYRSLSPNRYKSSHSYDPPAENYRKDVTQDSKPLSHPVPISCHSVQPAEDVLYSTRSLATAVAIQPEDTKSSVAKLVVPSHTSTANTNLAAVATTSSIATQNHSSLTSTLGNNEESSFPKSKKKKRKRTMSERRKKMHNERAARHRAGLREKLKAEKLEAEQNANSPKPNEE